MPAWQGIPVTDDWSRFTDASSLSADGQPMLVTPADVGVVDTGGSVTDSSANGTTEIPFCVFLVIHTIGNTHIGIWDLVLLIPNTLFLLYLISTMCHSARRLKQVASPVYNTFYVLVFLTCLMGTVRCAVTMSVRGFNSISDQALWLALRFFQLSTELSVLVLGLLFGHLDSRKSIQRVLIITVTISFAYVFTQGALQQLSDKDDVLDHNIYAHGGVPFWFGSSLLFFLVYVIVVMLRYVPSCNMCGLIIPGKPRFYYYALFMAFLNLLQSIGSGLILFTNPDASEGFCLIDVTTFFLFSLFSPIIYSVFLWGFFRPSFTRGNEQSHLLNISYNHPGEDNPRTSIISSPGDKVPTLAYVPGSYGTSVPKDVVSYPLSYSSLASSLDGDLKDELPNPSWANDNGDELCHSPCPEAMRSYGFRTPLDRSFVDSHDGAAAANQYNDNDLSDFEDLS